MNGWECVFLRCFLFNSWWMGGRVLFLAVFPLIRWWMGGRVLFLAVFPLIRNRPFQTFKIKRGQRRRGYSGAVNSKHLEPGAVRVVHQHFSSWRVERSEGSFWDEEERRDPSCFSWRRGQQHTSISHYSRSSARKLRPDLVPSSCSRNKYEPSITEMKWSGVIEVHATTAERVASVSRCYHPSLSLRMHCPRAPVCFGLQSHSLLLWETLFLLILH